MLRRRRRADRVLVYDTGALLAAERGRPEIFLMHEEAVAKGPLPLVPAVVLAQAWRGGPAHNLSRLLKGCRIVENVTELRARAAGELCGRAGTSDVVDALVVLLAKQVQAGIVVTSDPDDLKVLREAANATFTLRAV
jgi:hypothetical protein